MCAAEVSVFVSSVKPFILLLRFGRVKGTQKLHIMSNYPANTVSWCDQNGGSLTIPSPGVCL